MKRKFPCSEPDLLIIAETYFLNLRDDLAEVSKKQRSWNEQYIECWLARINDIKDRHYGIDIQQGKRAATIDIKTTFREVFDDIDTVRTQVQTNYPDGEEMLKQLGFARHWKKARGGNQKEMHAQLFAFEKGLIKLRTKIEENTDPSVLDHIISKTREYAAANVEQERQKVNTPLLTEQANERLNELYLEIQKISAIAKKIFKGKKTMQLRYTFSYLKKLLGQKRKKGENIDPSSLSDASKTEGDIDSPQENTND